MAKLICRIRKYRKSAQLTQLQLAKLVGLHSQGSLSEIESGRKRPSVAVAIACEIVFQTSIRELFPRLYACGTRQVKRSASRLTARLDKSSAIPTGLELASRRSHQGI